LTIFDFPGDGGGSGGFESDDIIAGGGSIGLNCDGRTCCCFGCDGDGDCCCFGCDGDVGCFCCCGDVGCTGEFDRPEGDSDCCDDDSDCCGDGDLDCCGEGDNEEVELDSSFSFCWMSGESIELGGGEGDVEGEEERQGLSFCSSCKWEVGLDGDVSEEKESNTDAGSGTEEEI